MIVGLTGYGQSGKDTAAQGLIDIGWERKSFADPLRECIYLLNPIISSQVAGRHTLSLAADMGSQGSGPEIEHLRIAATVDAVGWDEAKKHGEVRRLLQVFGTEVVRDHFGRDAWTHILVEQIKRDWDKNYVVTDCRFPNEVECIHNLGGIVVRISRPGVGPVNAHVSDAVGDLNVDYEVTNDGTPAKLWGFLKELVGA